MEVGPGTVAHRSTLVLCCERSSNILLLGFVEASLHRYGLLIHWLLVMDLTSTAAFLPSWKSGGRTEPVFMTGSSGKWPSSLGAVKKLSYEQKPSCDGKGLITTNKKLISPLSFQKLRTRDQTL